MISTIQTTQRQPALAFARWLALFVALAPLGACGPDRLSTGSIVTDQDYRVRHPIVLAEAPASLDLFVTGRGLDEPSLGRLREFAQNYHASGQGPITLSLPQNDGTRKGARATVQAIRDVLVAGGATGAINISSYPIANPALASPIHLSFVGLQAKVASQCGQWPEDLASGSSLEGWDNAPYWNYGCSYQSAIAAQVADPRDLVGPRAQGPSDVEMRTRAITDVRQGKDPGTAWLIKNSDIGQVGSN